MIASYPDFVGPGVSFEAASGDLGEHLTVWEDGGGRRLTYSSQPRVLIGYDGRAVRVREVWGPPTSAKTIGGKVLLWISGLGKSRPLVSREVTQIQLSLDEFKKEVCRRIPGEPTEVFNTETLVGEGLRPDVDREPILVELVERLRASVQAATTFPGVIDALLEAQRWRLQDVTYLRDI